MTTRDVGDLTEPCEYCGEMLNASGEQYCDAAASYGRIAHGPSMCRVPFEDDPEWQRARRLWAQVDLLTGVARYAEEAHTIANMAAVAVGDPER